MRSMTGYGRGEAVEAGFRAVVECASVNRKQAEVVWCGPRELAALEPLVREEVLRVVARGRVNVHAVVEAEGGPAAALDFERAAACARALRELARRLELEEKPTLALVLAAPGVVQPPEAAQAWPAVRKALAQALERLTCARQREGAALAKALRTRLQALRGGVRAVRPLARQVPKRHFEALRARLASARLPHPPDDGRLAAEFALLAERCDISEELDRIESHLKQFDAAMRRDGPVGRALEFLAQELAREWTTLSNKASDADIARHAVEARSLVEQLREQAANVE